MRIKETFVSRQNDDNTENFEELKLWREPAISLSQNKSKLPGSYRKIFGNPNAMYHHSLQSLCDYIKTPYWLVNVWVGRKAEFFGRLSLTEDGKKVRCHWKTKERCYLFTVSIWAARICWVSEKSGKLRTKSEVAITIPNTASYHWSVDLQLGHQRLHTA